MPSSKAAAQRPDIVVDNQPPHTSRKVARDSATEHRGGTVTAGDRAGYGGKAPKAGGSASSGRRPGPRHDGDGGVRSGERPAWLLGDVRIKTLDLHKFDTEEEAVGAVRSALEKPDASVAWEIVCGAGTHTDVNQYGSKVKETGDWKNKQLPLFFPIKKLIQSEPFISSCDHWIPTDAKNSSIYARCRGGADRRGAAAAPRCSYDDVAASIGPPSGAERRCPNAKIDTKARDDSRLEELAKLKAKEEGGEKLSNKDRRQLEKLRVQCADIEERRKSAVASEEESEDGGGSQVEDECFN